MQEWPYADQLRSFDRQLTVPQPNVGDQVAEMIGRGERRLTRPRMVVSVLVAIGAAASCWFTVTADPSLRASWVDARGDGAKPRSSSSRLAELDAEIQLRETQLAALREIQAAHQEMLRLSADYGERFAAQLDMQLVDTIAARTLLHSATANRDNTDTGQLRLIVRHFAGSDEANQAAELLSSDQL